MGNLQDIKLKGLFFFKRLKKGDSGYYKRLNERYQDIKKNAVKYTSMTEQEIFYSYIELMDAVLEIQNKDSSENGS
ncbi:MAG: hypothetical protein HeimC3_32670 [Candidatus Heimdallarchaeota archaeon LC_3]|nr:MAG: hypothetical protein HeimC3_32670 [Candidatus Heimdallarchaeota archaeon LC_3]